MEAGSSQCVGQKNPPRNRSLEDVSVAESVEDCPLLNVTRKFVAILVIKTANTLHCGLARNCLIN